MDLELFNGSMQYENACFHHYDHLDFLKHLINIYLLKTPYVNSQMMAINII